MPGRPQPEWRDYEEQIHERLKDLVGEDGIVVFDKKIRGQFSRTIRQVDIWVEGSFAGGLEKGIRAAVDCKHFSKRITLPTVEAFMGLVQDVGADLGIMVTSTGYSEPAKQRVANQPFRLHVIPKVDLVDIEEFWDWEPIWEDPDPEPAEYVGDFYDFEPYGDAGAVVTYTGSDREPSVLLGPDVHWGDEAEKRRVIAAILEHSLGRSPDPEAVDGFLHEYGDDLEDGQPFSFAAHQVEHMAY